MPLTNDIVTKKLTDRFGDQLTDFETPYGLLSFVAPKD
jgi:NADH-quinone oxidoreductase subunit C